MNRRGPFVRFRYTYRGTIQGVGFRPAVFRCAVSLGLSGFVRNERSEVRVEVQGPAEQVDRFPMALDAVLPAAACIESVRAEPIPALEEHGFRILESAAGRYTFPPIPPDLAVCPDCLRELFDPADRRYLYPFITCTQCGPRYSIVVDTPFDRGATSMAEFPPCPDCRAEYDSPGDRRFHAQVNSCPVCGPRLKLAGADGRPLPGDPVMAAIRALDGGRVVAVQGIGGFHLAADPCSTAAMARLRRDKERERQPFALMVADPAEAERLCRVSPEAAQRLSSAESPILILPARPAARREMAAVSSTGTLGVMLPYTPLHRLLFHHPHRRLQARALVMTSGNRRGEPIVTDPREAFEKLGGCAELFLFHDRRIVFRTDDSVLRIGGDGRPVLLRRSRGYVPRLVRLRRAVRRTVLGVGGDLKSAPALAFGEEACLAPFIGDLEDPRTLADFEAQVHRILALYAVQPEAVAHDLHPLYHSTRWALEGGNGGPGTRVARRIGVQHHHAHLLAVMAEHGLEEAIGLAFDGTGYGPDGTVWGGEFLYATRRAFRRLGCFRPFSLPGGEAAVTHPLRIAAALLHGRLPAPRLRRLLERSSSLAPDGRELLLGLLERRVRTPLCSSLGRLFDAAAALLGLVDRVSYEGEGPMLLEGAARQGLDEEETAGGRIGGGLLPLLAPREPDGPFLLDWEPLFDRLAEDAGAGSVPPGDPGPPALLFHREVAGGALAGARAMRARTSLSRLVLGGGVFQNVLLRDLLLPALRRDGFEVYLNEAVPPGDGGLALGQVYFEEPE